MGPTAGWQLPPVERREAEPAPRPEAPTTVRGAVALMVAGAVLAVVDGVANAVGLDRDDVARQLVDAGVSPGDLDGYVTILRVAGVGLGLVAAGVWIAHAVATHRGRAWVRPWATLLGTIFVLGGLFATARGGSALDAAYRVLRIAVATGAVALLWAPASTTFLRAGAPTRGG